MDVAPRICFSMRLRSKKGWLSSQLSLSRRIDSSSQEGSLLVLYPKLLARRFGCLRNMISNHWAGFLKVLWYTLEQLIDGLLIM